METSKMCEVLRIVHKQDSMYFLLGSLISADNNMNEQEEKLNKEELENIIEAFEEIATHENPEIPLDKLEKYHKLALDAHKIFDK